MIRTRNMSANSLWHRLVPCSSWVSWASLARTAWRHLALALFLSLATALASAQIVALGYTLTISPIPTHGRVTSSPGSINCGGSVSSGTVCSGIFLGTTPVTLTATPDSNYVFLRWTSSLGSPTSNPIAFPMPSYNLAVAASFATVPGAPGIGAAVPGNAQATIAFTAPASNGGSPITLYTATCNPGSHLSYGTASPITVTSLANGTGYLCSVAAMNEVGTGPASGSVSVTPRTVPGAPTIRYVNDTAVGQVSIHVVPASNGGAPITAVNVTCNPGGYTASGVPPSVDTGLWDFWFTTLNTGVDYSCVANAVNAAGTSPPSVVVNLRPAANIVITSPPLPAGVVGRPYSHTFTATGGCGSITWRYEDSPFSIPGLSLNSSTGVLSGTPTTPTTPPGANQATPIWYMPRFIAESSTPNPESVTVYCSRNRPFGYDITIATVPGAPVIGTAAPGNGQATVSFTPPASNGGLPITGYQATCNPGAFWAAGTASPITVGGLANGTRYTCSVTATNAAGAGPASATVTVTPDVNAGAVFPMTVNSSIGPTTTTVSVVIWPRAQDAAKTWNIYVFAIAPANRVQTAAAADALTLGKATSDTDDKVDSVACVLAQLNASGQLKAVSISGLQAYVNGVLSSQGQAVTVVNGVATANIAGATFYVGYGSSPTDMIVTGMNRSVVGVPGEQFCQPQAPQTGWWWNPAESGRGYTIESSGNKIFIAAYLYDVTGRATWYISAGPASLDGSLYTGNLESYANGQSLTGAYRSPTLPPAIAGTITLAFSDAHNGTLVWPGGTVAIRRYEYGTGGVNAVPQANQPENGWWWNASESGRGYFIEWQAGVAVMAGYMYDEGGNPLWYYARADTPNAQALSTSWEQYANGQTLTGTYRSNTRINPNVGPVTIQFQGAQDAIMTLPGGRQLPLTRYRF
jgi:hypothetical protein